MPDYEGDELAATLRAQFADDEWSAADEVDDAEDFASDAPEVHHFHLLGDAFEGPFADYDDQGNPRLEVARLVRGTDAMNRKTWVTESDCTGFCAADATRGDVLDALGPGRYRIRLRRADGTLAKSRDLALGDAKPGRKITMRDRQPDQAPQPAADQRVTWLEKRMALMADEHDAAIRRVRENHQDELARVHREHEARIGRLQREIEDERKRRARSDDKLAEAQEAREAALREKRDVEFKLLRAEVAGQGGGTSAGVLDQLRGQIGQLQELQEFVGSLGNQTPTPSTREQMMSKIAETQQMIGGLVGMAKTFGG